jgi:hypothetical protein
MRKDHSGLSPLPRGRHDEAVATASSTVSRTVLEQVETALRSLQVRLTPEQLELVRAVLLSSLETDPVCRLLAETADAADAHLREALPAPRR